MCAGALVNARLRRLVFGASDPKAGAVRTLRSALLLDPNLWPAAFYLALSYEKLGRAEDAHRDVAAPVPLHLRNAPTKLMKDLAYGKGYQYAHNEADAVTGMSCLPAELAGRTYYEPKDRGFEKEIKRRLDGWAEIKKQRKTSE